MTALDSPDLFNYPSSPWRNKTSFMTLPSVAVTEKNPLFLTKLRFSSSPLLWLVETERQAHGTNRHKT